MYARVTKPIALDASYIKVLVEPQKTLAALKGGFLIVVIGVVVYGMVSCGYLYFKRKYKNPEYFHEETEAHAPKDDVSNPASGTVEQIHNTQK